MRKAPPKNRTGPDLAGRHVRHPHNSATLPSHALSIHTSVCNSRRQHPPRTARQRYQRHGSQRYPDLSPGSYSTPDTDGFLPAASVQLPCAACCRCPPVVPALPSLLRRHLLTTATPCRNLRRDCACDCLHLPFRRDWAVNVLPVPRPSLPATPLPLSLPCPRLLLLFLCT